MLCRGSLLGRKLLAGPSDVVVTLPHVDIVTLPHVDIVTLPHVDIG